MATKFVSKNANLMVVLRPGVEGSRVLGKSSVPGLYARFQSGTLDVKDQEMIELLREHPAFNSDFIEVEDQADPYAHTRSEMEPQHVISEIEHGSAKKQVVSKKPIVFSPEVKKVIEAEAIKLLPELLKKNPEILKNVLKDLVKAEEVGKDLSEEKTSTRGSESLVGPSTSDTDGITSTKEDKKTDTSKSSKK